MVHNSIARIAKEITVLLVLLASDKSLHTCPVTYKSFWNLCLWKDKWIRKTESSLWKAKLIIDELNR